MKKVIVFQWVKDPNDFMYGGQMIIIASNHPKFILGSIFDFGSFSTATEEGYIIVSLPATNS